MNRFLPIIACSIVGFSAPAKSSDIGGSFVDHFDQFDSKRWYISDGWTNGAHQNCMWSKHQIKMQDGAVHLGFSEQKIKDLEYACAEIQTRQKFGYGTYEARLKTPTGSGLNAAFFTYIGYPSKEPHDEIDFEFLLKDTREVQLNSYVNGVGGNEKMVPLLEKSNHAFSDYAFTWEPKRLRFYVNGKLMHTIDDPSKVPDQPSKIFFSLWSTGTLTDWLGPFQPPSSPIFFEIQRLAYTKLGEACQFEDSLACQ